MSISKYFLLEQLNRSKATTDDELKLYDITKDKEKHIGDVYHDFGHLDTIKELEDYIKNNNYTKKDLRKRLNNMIKKSNKISGQIENKYDKNWDDLDLPENQKDNKELFYQYGIDCECINFKDVVNGKKYYNKSCYEPTDWKGWIKNK